MSEEPSVRARNIEVVVLDGDRRQQVVDELLTVPAPSAIGQLDADEELCCGDGRRTL